MMKHRLFTLPGCPHCGRARTFLARHGIDHVEIDVSTDVEAQREMMTMTGRTEVPALVAGYQAVVGFNEDTWLRVLDDADAVARDDPFALPAILGEDPHESD